MKHLNIRVRGRVQGVGFRYAANQEAEKLGIACSARNEPDGSVYIEVEGEEAMLLKFLAWCRKGPWFAKVEEVESEWSEDENGHVRPHTST